jgi:ferritin-like metal-binding protein YciE
MATVDSLRALLEEELKDLYDAEKQLIKALPKLAKKASSPDLKEAFNEHLGQTEEHVERLEQAFERLGLPVRGKSCKGMRNLISEGNEMIAEAEDDATRDALMIAAAQKVEHYEISSYGTIRTWANLLGKSDVAALLQATLDEEKTADQKLTGIAESHVNVEAAEGEEEVENVSPRMARTGGRQAGRVRRTSTTRGSLRRQQAAERAKASSSRGTKRSRRSR